MQIIGVRHYKGDQGETISFNEGEKVQVGSVATPKGALPQALPGGQHGKLTVSVAFTGDSGGSAIVVVTGSNGGRDEASVPQLDGLPIRDLPFYVD